MPAQAYVPPGRPTAKHLDLPEVDREAGEAELRLLRSNDQWRSASILERLGPAKEEKFQLPCLMVGAAALLGPQRVFELCERMRSHLNRAQPRIQQLIKDESLGMFKDPLKEVLKRLRLADEELPEVRSRAANEMDIDVSHPGGLRLLDLQILVEHLYPIICASEISSRRNQAGIRFSFGLAQTPPDLRYAEEWMQRLFGARRLRGVRLFWPQQYGRVVVVHEDGRLAYDPLPVEPEAEEDDHQV